MSSSKAFASLSASLLARKGGARPAMRPQLGGSSDSLARNPMNDLGWNDLGDPVEADGFTAAVNDQDHDHDGDTVPFTSVTLARKPAAIAERGATVVPMKRDFVPSILTRPPLRTRRAAFTLRLDPLRHMRLRLACTATGRSAQALVTDAVDRLLDSMTDLEVLADPIGRPRLS